MTAGPTVVVVTDANLIINLIHTSRLRLLGQLRPLRFVVPENVVAEIVKEDQPRHLAEAIASGLLEVCSITDGAELSQFAGLRSVMGAGESACLVLAEARGWHVASDEGGRFRREVIARIGKDRLLTTPAIYVLAIRAGLLTVAEADQDKAHLATKRFVMPFGSFGELLRSA